MINEKIFALDNDIDKADVKIKVEALQSIESVVSLNEIAKMQVFMSKYDENGDGEDTRITLKSLKDIDNYAGYSYIDEVNAIKTDLEKKYKESIGMGHAPINFNIPDLVDYIVEERDTTKFNSNMFEKILSKCSENIDIKNSAEGLVVLNKARVLTTAFVTADKLGYLSKEELDKLRNSLMA